MCSEVFDSIIKPLICNGHNTVLEIGAQKGLNTNKIIAVIRSLGGRLTSIDPAPQFIPDDDIHFFQEFSIPFLKNTDEVYDLIIVDGDHNWYTVFHELLIMEEREILKPRGIILHHDICWPYAKRDLYYFPDRIPEEFRNPYSRGGLIKGEQGLFALGKKINGCDPLNPMNFHALFEGGPGNGVLTAIEEYLRESRLNWDIHFDYDKGVSSLKRLS